MCWQAYSGNLWQTKNIMPCQVAKVRHDYNIYNSFICFLVLTTTPESPQKTNSTAATPGLLEKYEISIFIVVVSRQEKGAKITMRRTPMWFIDKKR